MGVVYFASGRSSGTVGIPHPHCAQRAFWLLFLGRCAATSAGLPSRDQPAQQTEKSAKERFQKIMAL
jgi:7,8-dihydro-6-hydroxymethylpterin-pyrophosphokinase